MINIVSFQIPSKLILLAAISLLVPLNSCSKKQNDNNLSNSDLSQVEVLLSQMTLDEKIGQMNQYNGFWDTTGPTPSEESAKLKYGHLKSGLVGSVLNVAGVEKVRKFQKIAVEETRLGIPLLFGLDVMHGHKTVNPIPLAEAASWDLQAIEDAARMSAIEASARGINWTFAPMVDISRDARWGRVMEGAGEDPYLGSKVGVARVEGYQGTDLTQYNTLAATAKHFAGYGFSESGRDYNTVDVNNSTLYNVILPPFKACIDAGVLTVMNSFNTLNGIPATGNKFLQRDILKGNWDFKGFIVSDWSSGKEMIAHGYAVDEKDAAIKSANAGSDMDMESYIYVKYLKEAVEEGSVDISVIDDAVLRILKVKEALGLFDDPYRYCDQLREDTLLNHPNHTIQALEMAKKSIVLLKNDSLLPLSKNQTKLAVIGTLAADKNSPLGNWRIGSSDHSAVSVLEGLDNLGIKYNYAPGVKLTVGKTLSGDELNINTTDKSQFEEAIALAKRSNKVIMVLGEHGFMTGEGRSRTDIGLPGLQQELLQKIYAVNKNIILILMNGRPLTITWADEHIPSILEVWHLGSQSGNAIAETLFGMNNPSGKLPMSFPRSVGQIPIYYNHFNTGRPGPIKRVFWSHYSDEENTPLYPFGHGLSYTEFTYSNIEIKNNYAENQEIIVTVDVSNIGKAKGREVVQLYLKDEAAKIVRPVRELKGFKIVELNPGDKKQVKIVLKDTELGYYDNHGDYVIEDGLFTIFVGGDSNAILLKEFNLQQN